MSLFETFVREQSTGLLQTSFLLTGDLASAEDLLQETLTRLYPNWSRVDGADTPVAYVRRCLLNEYLNSRRRPTLPVIDFALRNRPGPESDLEDTVADHDQTTRLLRRLNERQRAAVVLRYFHALSDTEIATMLGCREPTVRSLLRRALLAMRAAADAPPIGPHRRNSR